MMDSLKLVDLVVDNVVNLWVETCRHSLLLGELINGRVDHGVFGVVVSSTSVAELSQ